MFIILISILGFAIGIRNSELLIAGNLFEKRAMTKIGTAYLVLVLILLFALPRGYFSVWISIFVPLLITAIAVFVIMKKRAMDFRDSFIAALTLISLKMKAGRSFRQSFSEVAAESEPRLRAKLSEIGSAVVFSPQNPDPNRNSLQLNANTAISAFTSHQFIGEVVEELIRIDRQPHAASRRLAVFRDKLRLEDDFRRRSGQVLARIRAQSLIMTGLYVALAFFMAIKFGWRENSRLFAISLGLFTSGAIWLWRGGRNLKWKV
jgi:hypothetical protein